MFPLKAAFTPKDSSRWFAFNSRLQGGPARGQGSLWSEKGLDGIGSRTGDVQGATHIHRGPRQCTRASLSRFRPAKILTPLQS